MSIEDGTSVPCPRCGERALSFIEIDGKSDDDCGDESCHGHGYTTRSDIIGADYPKVISADDYESDYADEVPDEFTAYYQCGACLVIWNDEEPLAREIQGPTILEHIDLIARAYA